MLMLLHAKYNPFHKNNITSKNSIEKKGLNGIEGTQPLVREGTEREKRWGLHALFLISPFSSEDPHNWAKCSSKIVSSQSTKWCKKMGRSFQRIASSRWSFVQQNPLIIGFFIGRSFQIFELIYLFGRECIANYVHKEMS